MSNIPFKDMQVFLWELNYIELDPTERWGSINSDISDYIFKRKFEMFYDDVKKTFNLDFPLLREITYYNIFDHKSELIQIMRKLGELKELYNFPNIDMRIAEENIDRHMFCYIDGDNIDRILKSLNAFYYQKKIDKNLYADLKYYFDLDLPIFDEIKDKNDFNERKDEIVKIYSDVFDNHVLLKEWKHGKI